MTVTGLADAPDGQSVCGGLTVKNVRNKVADYFLTDNRSVPWQMSKTLTAKYMKLKKRYVYMNFN
jgi:hypothetical protein